MNIISRFCLISSLVGASALLMQATPIVAYSNPTGAGNQTFPGSLGMDFNVISAAGINVYSVGVFDSSQNGLAKSLTVSFYNLANTATPVLTTSIPTGTGGTVIGGDRFYALALPLFLAPGNYSIVAQGFSESDPNGNSNPLGMGGSYGTLDTGGGLISFVGNSRWGLGSGFPTGADYSAAKYGAGTFTYGSAAVQTGGGEAAATPEPGSAALLGAGLLVVGFWSRRLKKQ
jgi:hypothetical protein